MKHWYVYIIEATDTCLYTGITIDIERRWLEHSGADGTRTKGAKFFRGRKPKYLRFVKRLDNRSQASQLEAKIKRLNRRAKILLIESDENQRTELSLTTI